jgi:hypothetical protein
LVSQIASRICSARAWTQEKWNGQLPSAIYAGAPIPFLNVK